MSVIRRKADPRVVRTRAAVVDAGRALFLSRGYGGTTVEDIAARAGLTKRTVYNNYPDKEALFRQIVADVTGFADAFVRGLSQEFSGMTAANLHSALDALGQRLALGIVRQDVVAIRRLLIGESREFPSLAKQYFDRAPGQVLDALASGFRRLHRNGLLNVTDSKRAASQFAYLVAGEALDRAMLVGTIPAKRQIVAAARDGVRTFIARYAS
jgi:TetR/AcrR family transcriptional regulator, mexJK operon transcriptional repressor